MSEYRQDPLSRRWVLVGCDERAGRPNEFVEEVKRGASPCPFCAGHESETPPAIAVYPSGPKQAWLVRVVPNKYPAVMDSLPVTSGPPPLVTSAATEPIPGFGRHEVIIESNRHVASFSGLTDEEAALVFHAYRDRLRDLARDGRYRYVQIFKNVGPGAGASLEHGHSQLLALPGVPDVILQELNSCAEYAAAHRGSLVADLVAAELSAQTRVVAATPRFVALCPYASRFPYEVWIVPRRNQAQFELVEDSELGELSLVVRDAIGRIERALGQVPYNYFLHTVPFDTARHDHYHWHIEIIPRLTKVAGFEWSTGCFINPYPPELAAARLRAA